MKRRMMPLALLTSIVALTMLLMTDGANAARKRPLRKQAGRTAKKRTPTKVRRNRTTTRRAKKQPRRKISGKTVKPSGRSQTRRTVGGVVFRGLKGRIPSGFHSNHPNGANVKSTNSQARSSRFIPFFGPAGLLLPAVQKARAEKPQGLLPAVQKSR